MFGFLKDKLRSFVGKAADLAGVEGKIEEPRLSAATRVKAVFSERVRLSESDLDSILYDLQIGLLESDVAVETAEDILKKLRARVSSAEIEKAGVGTFVRDSLREILLEAVTAGKEFDLVSEVKSAKKPCKILFLGVNGTGKTTTMAKVAHLLKKSGFGVVFAAGDTFRAGAIEQLQKHGDALGVRVVSQQKGADSAAVFYDAVEYARARGVDVVLADSAGRMQTNKNLMDELKKVVRVNQPDVKIFVGDALAGNDAVEQAREFNSIVGVDAVILAKLDADSKGGAALSITHEIGKPIILVGVGQKYEDIRPFDREWFVGQLV